ncbi:hypothetical protein CFP56_030993 [Quercus suber]|uniref:Uncharacterized protein n=1 Tax=Quercus suber TaxID=58331 RepID=A0AAW0JLJ2_QUESU
MAESKTKLESLREWVVDHKLRTVVMRLEGKTRLHAQALTLAALAGAAVVEFYDRKARAGAGGEQKDDRYSKFLPIETYSHKD